MSTRRIRVGDFKINSHAREMITEIMNSGRISEGPFVRKFERKFADMVGARYCVATSSGTSALLAVFLANRHQWECYPRRNQVYTTPLTYIADANAVSVAGFDPIFVDVERFGFNMAPESLKQAIVDHEGKRKGAAVLPVHLFGFPANMPAICTIAEEAGLEVIEDCAQAHLSMLDGQEVGRFGHCAIYSFYCAHAFVGGELGCVTTNDPSLVRLLRQVKANGRLCACDGCSRGSGLCRGMVAAGGSDPRFTHVAIGLNLKANEFAAAIALSQLGSAGQILARRREVVSTLNDRLSKFSWALHLPEFRDTVSYLAYPIVIDSGACPVDAQTLRHRLEERGVETRPIFPAIPTRQPAYGHLKTKYYGKLPNAEHISDHGLYIGCHQFITEDDLVLVEQAFKEALQA